MSKRIERELLLLLIPISSIILTAVLYALMPDKIPVSYALSGRVIGYADKSLAVFLLPVLSLFFYLYLLVVPKIDIVRDSYTRFERGYTIMRLSGGLALLVINALYVLNIFFPDRIEVIIAFKAIVAVGLMFFGDRLPQVKRNHFIGVVNPWTLRSNNVWMLTQRFTGKLLFGTGFVLFIFSFANMPFVNAAYIAILVGLMIAPHIYSVNKFYRKVD